VPVEQRRPDTPPDLAMIVMRLLEKEPANRFSGADELEQVLRGGRPVMPASYATTQPPLPRHAPIPPAPSQQGRGASGYAPAPAAPSGRPFDERAYGNGAYGGAAPYGRLPATLADTGEGEFTPTQDEYERWDAPPVVEFRRKLGWFAIIGSVLFVVGVVGNSDFFGFLGLWAVYIAFKYAKLWSNGFDWRDVAREPRERLFADVAAEWGDGVQAIFDRDKRARVRDRERRRRLGSPTRPASLSAGSGYAGGRSATYNRGGDGGYTPPASSGPADYGRQADVVRQALADRDEIFRLLGTMPKAERDRIPEVAPSARALAEKVESLAVLTTELERNAAPGAIDVLEQEITRLEGEANPLDRERSEERVKRLAYLKRQRRTLADASRRREAAASKLENCRLALQNMRLDLVRLRTGAGGSPGHVTTVAERAMALAREVDGLVGAAEEVRGAVGIGARASQPGRG
jgi:serine/threonine-protein kinase